MLKNILMTGFCLILFSLSPSPPGASHGMAATDAAGRTDGGRNSTHPLYANASTTEEMVACTEPRPQVCTQDYRPVCALLQDGGLKTYSNGCSACSDPAVTGYREGVCD
jgi:hypothetical protein